MIQIAELDEFTTPDELAVMLKITRAQVLELRRQHSWASVKVGRHIRFTREQVQQIVERHTKAPEVAAPVEMPAIPGQTARSARRSR